MPLDAILTNISNASGANSGQALKRSRVDAGLIGDNNVSVQELAKKFDLLCKISSDHDRRIATCEAFMENVFFLPPSSNLASQILKAMEEWNKKKPSSGGHPLGHANLTVAAVVIKFLCDSSLLEGPGVPKAWLEQHSAMKEFAQSLNSLDNLKVHVAIGVGKLTKKGDKMLLKLAWKPCSPLSHSYNMQFHLLGLSGAEVSTGAAPRGPLMRELHGEQIGKLGGA